MTRKEFKERCAFEAILMDEAELKQDMADYLRPAARQLALTTARLICRHGKTYARLQEMNCNGVGTWYNEDPKSFAKRQDRFEKWVEKREGQIERRITYLLKELGAGFEPMFQGDPRGSTIKIKVPSGRTNDYGREGICVPTA